MYSPRGGSGVSPEYRGGFGRIPRVGGAGVSPV